jgi:hypothetical protein
VQPATASTLTMWRAWLPHLNMVLLDARQPASDLDQISRKGRISSAKRFSTQAQST